RPPAGTRLRSVHPGLLARLPIRRSLEVEPPGANPRRMVMAPRIALQSHGVHLSEAAERQIDRQLRGLERRLVNRPDPEVVVVLKGYPDRRQFEADIRVLLGPLGHHLVSRQTADTAARAARLAVAAI